MECPECGTPNTRVLDTFKGSVTRRRRQCSCGVTFSSTEAVDKGTIRAPLASTNGIRRDQSQPVDTGPNGPQPLAANSSVGVGGGLSSGSDLALFPADLLPSQLPDPSEATDQQVDPARVKPRKPKREETPAFATFYDAYPRKVARDAAWRMWLSMGCESVASAVMAALAWQVPMVFAKAPPDKVPYPASWLHDGRWKDPRPGAANGAHAPAVSMYPSIARLAPGVPRPPR
jgi:hypothetical protein